MNINDCKYLLQYPTVVIYHANCTDGIAAAAVAREYLGERTSTGEQVIYHPGVYGRELPDSLIVDKLIFFLDFTPKREQFLDIKERAIDVIVLDHHKTAQEEIGDLVDIDQTKSGAVLAWEYFFPNKPVSLEYLMIQDRDLWKWELPDSKAYSHYLSLYPITIEGFKEANTRRYEERIKLGELVGINRDHHAKAYAAKARMVNFEGEVIPCVNCPAEYVSETSALLYEYVPFVITYMDISDRRIYSLRSSSRRHPEVDVSLIAKKYGGGGHKNAAGFAIHYSDPLFKTLLEE